MRFGFRAEEKGDGAPAKFRVDGELAVVTGGARLVLIEPDAAVGQTGCAALASRGLQVESIVGDVTSSARMNEIADELTARGTPATILVNNAGIGSSGISSEDVEDARWLRIMDVNVNGVFWCSRAFGRHMLALKRGAIVDLGSMSGTICNRPQPQTPYNVSNAAVHHMTRSMAAEWAPHGVRINAVAPTYIETPMVNAVPENRDRIPIWLNDTPMGRIGRADEVANAVLFLACDASSLMTGAVVPVDGGFTCW